MVFKKIFSNHPQRICPSFLVAALIFSVFTLTGIVSAAWVDAPNVPPGYGASGCSPYPCLEMDFKPFNLGSTTQTKQAGATFVGDITADMFADRQNPLAYYIDPSGNGGISAMLSGDVHINNSIPGGAKLVVNNPSDDTKTGLPNDAIYAYANSANAAIAAEQGNSAGYAIYSSGGINYFGGNVGIGKEDPQMKLDVLGNVSVSGSLCLNGDCKNNWPLGVGAVDFISCSVAEYIPSCTATCPGGKMVSAFGVLTQGPDCTGSPSVTDGGTSLNVFRTNNCNNTATTYGASCAIGVASSYAPGMQTYDTPGTYSFVVPASVYSINVEVWGGGGGSGYGIFSLNYDNSDFGRNTGGAGASGAYAKKMAIPVSPGDTFTVNVGAGGVGAARPTTKGIPTTKGATGGISSFVGPGASLSANGGEGAFGFDGRFTSGTYNGVTFCNDAHLPIGGTATGGTTNISGLNGASCIGGADSPVVPDIPGAMPPVTVDHNDNPLLFLFGRGGVGHHYPINPYTSNLEANANSGNGGGVIVWW